MKISQARYKGIIGWTINCGVSFIDMFKSGFVNLLKKRKIKKLLPSLIKIFKVNFKIKININNANI